MPADQVLRVEEAKREAPTRAPPPGSRCVLWLRSSAGFASAQDKHPVYVGVKVCAKCHSDEATGNQYGVWQSTKHAQAYKALFTPEAKAMAQLSGILDPPEKAFICLGCHATAADSEPWERDPTFSIDEGMQCERCHGPGSEYIDVMKDPEAARKAGLKMLSAHDCAACHYAKGSHVAVHHKPPLDIAEGLRRIAHPRVRTPDGPAATPAATVPAPSVREASIGKDILGIGLEVQYKTPRNLVFTPDGREVLVSCEAGNSLIVVDAARRLKVAEITVGRQPADVAISPDQTRAYVSNRLDDTVSVIDLPRRQVVGTIPVGDEPHGLLTDRTGATLYVLNTSSGDISVIDTARPPGDEAPEGEPRPLVAGPAAPTGAACAVTNTLSRFVPFREPLGVGSDGRGHQAPAGDRTAPPCREANLLQGVPGTRAASSPSSR